MVGKRNCDETIARVYPYLDGETTWYRRVRVRLHLRNCHNCTDAFAFEEQLKLTVRRKSRTDPPAEFILRLRDYLRESD